MLRSDEGLNECLSKILLIMMIDILDLYISLKKQ